MLPLNTEKYSAKPIRNVSVKVDLESKRPLKSIYSPSHAVEVKRDGAEPGHRRLRGQRCAAGYRFRALFCAREGRDRRQPADSPPGDEDGYFLLLASPGVDVKEKQVVLKDVAFVLDTSGSMAGKKLEQAKKALQFCVENLNDGDRFEIIRFSTEVEPLFDKLVDGHRGATAPRRRSSSRTSGPWAARRLTTPCSKALALRPGAGATAPSSSSSSPTACPTIGTTDEDQIVANVKKASEGRTRVFCFGIGTDVNTHLLDRITEETRAVSQYVLPEEDLEVKVSNFFAKIKEPVLANPTLKFTGDIRATKLYPSPLPDLFKGEQLVLVGRYSGKGDAAVIVEGTVNGAARKFTYEVNFPEEASGERVHPAPLGDAARRLPAG